MRQKYRQKYRQEPGRGFAPKKNGGTEMPPLQRLDRCFRS